MPHPRNRRRDGTISAEWPRSRLSPDRRARRPRKSSAARQPALSHAGKFCGCGGRQSPAACPAERRRSGQTGSREQSAADSLQRHPKLHRIAHRETQSENPRVPRVPLGCCVRSARDCRITTHFPYSFFTTSPPFITNFTRSSVVTSFTGSPSTATMSAHAPGSRLPTLPDQPSRSAAFTVAA